MNHSNSGIINASTTESAEDMQAAGKHYGFEMEIETVKQGFADRAEEEAAAAASAAETAKTAPVAAPATPAAAAPKDSSKPGEGEKPAEVEQAVTETDAKPPADLEPAEQADQDKDREKHKKLLKQVDRLTGRYKTAEGLLEAERQRVTDLERRLAEGKKEPEPAAAAPPEPDAPKRPDRPKRPKLAEFEYDDARHEAALDTYDSETLPAYEDELSKWTRAETLRELAENQEQEAERQAAERETSKWNEVLDSKEGLREKIAGATEIKVSQATQSVLLAMFDPEARASIYEYLIDNPDEAEDLVEATTSKRSRPNRDDWEFCTTKAAMLLAELKFKVSKAAPAATKPTLVPKPVAAPAPAAAPVKTETPAKPKPPVSGAPSPIEPVGDRQGATGSAIETDDTQAYMQRRSQELAQRRQRQNLR